MHRQASDAGNSLIAVLVVVLILGVMSAIALGGGLANPQPVASATKGHVASACRSDFNSVAQAVQSYLAGNFAYPAPGRAWALSDKKGGPYLTAWPGDPGHYAIVWDGQQVEVIPAHGAASTGSYGGKAPSTGCFAT